ncbi:MAG: NAD(P)/FAD-dependent oxidoreductase [Hyphomicrobiaceae bacterium]|nr:NAD(P)/FAD-dependent oxidoreductase [Hyphomicrobiaceae bacterium]
MVAASTDAEPQTGSGIAAPDADVLVVGLGPAGACAAAAAARGGARVVAIDRKREAGVPVQCAEFVPAMIGQEVAAVAIAKRQPIRAMTTFVEDQPPHLKENFPGVMIDRVAFDAALVEAARAAGAACWFARQLRRFDADGTAHLSDGSTIRARVIVGADGPGSPVGEAIGHPVTEIAESRQMTVRLLQPFAETDIFLTSQLPGGYAWLFPKGDVANLGLGGAPAHKARFKPLLDDLHRQLADQGRVGGDVLGYTGGAIPVGGPVDPVGRLGDALVLLAGDAAGLTNPITGAGINAAVVSGELAGEAAARWLKGRADAAVDYSDEIAALFGASLARAVERRRELMRIYEGGGRPRAADLTRSWIAFPEYWAA